MEHIQFCKGGGCTAKLGPAVLDRILSKLNHGSDENLLVGFDSRDDAAVYRLTDNLASVQTLDFFPPMVEDPYTFGQIAAANAMSDVWAMGGEVKTALNIVCFPEGMDLNILGAIIEGGNDKVCEAGALLVGGHSINDESVKYGLSVMGTVDPKKILSNDGAKADDVLLFTKPLGVGIICTADRVQAASDAAMRKAVHSMSTLNKGAAEVLRDFPVDACTDVTGFGLLVHLTEMLGDKLSAEIFAKDIPVIPEALDYADDLLITAAGERNRQNVENEVTFDKGISFAMQEVLYDPQTSGGLLIAASDDDAPKILAKIGALGLPCAVIGRFTERKDKKIFVHGTR